MGRPDGVDILGPAGTAIVTNASNIHAGELVSASPPLLCAAANDANDAGDDARDDGWQLLFAAGSDPRSSHVLLLSCGQAPSARVRALGDRSSCGGPTVQSTTRSQSMQQTWTVLQHNGPDHLGPAAGPINYPVYSPTGKSRAIPPRLAGHPTYVKDPRPPRSCRFFSCRFFRFWLILEDSSLHRRSFQGWLFGSEPLSEGDRWVALGRRVVRADLARL